MTLIGRSAMALLTILIVQLSVATTASSQESAFLPKQEAEDLLTSYRKDLGTKAAAPPSLPNLPQDRFDALIKEAEAEGVPSFLSTLVFAIMPDRVNLVRRDFFATNLVPIEKSLVNVQTLGLPVLREDAERLKQAKLALDKYDTQLQELQKSEWDLIEKRFRLGVKRIKEYEQKIEAIDKQYPAQYGGGTGDNAKRTAALDEAYRHLKDDLLTRWMDLDQEESALSAKYVRKTFLFEIPSPYSGRNVVTMLVDGDQYYPRIDELLADVAAKGNGAGSVHIALWWCHADTPITASETFIDALKKVADAGDEIQVLLWVGSDYGFKREKVDNADCAARINAFGGKAQAQLIDSSHWVGSHHDKYFVFYNGSDYRALIGGLNIDPGEWDSNGSAAGPHPRSSGGWQDVHDAGAEIEGPAVMNIDIDFGIRWSKTKGQRTIYTHQPSYKGTDDVAVMVTHDEIPSPTRGSGAYPAKTSIRDELLQRIAAADRYVYLENYAVTDEPLIKALGAKLAQERRLGRPFDVIVLLHKDWSNSRDNTTYGWLHRITYLALSFMVTGKFTYLDDKGVAHDVDRAKDGTALWSVGPYKGDWNEDTLVSWSSGGATSSAKLTRITSFGQDVPLYYLAYHSNSGDAPIWVHSKVAFIDDDVFVVGSANFNPRSMALDGELDAFVRGPSAGIWRRTLWQEYWGKEQVPDPKDWSDAVQQLVGSSLADGREVVLPLHLADFPGDLAKMKDRMPFPKSRLVDASWY